MTRKEYIRELVERLGHMAEADRMEAIRYYQEYFDEAGPECEEEVIKNLGTPAQVAKQILTDYAVRDSVVRPQAPTKSSNAIWWVLLAIVASPVILPVVGTVFGLLMGLIGTIGGLLIGGIATTFALCVSSFAILAEGVSMTITAPATGAIYLGIGMIFIGVSILILVVLYLLIGKYLPLLVGRIYVGIKKLTRKGESI